MFVTNDKRCKIYHQQLSLFDNILHVQMPSTTAVNDDRQ